MHAQNVLISKAKPGAKIVKNTIQRAKFQRMFPDEVFKMG